MADGLFPTLISKSRDANLVTNPIFVELSDGTTAISVTTGSLDVNISNLTVTITGTITTNYEYDSDTQYVGSDIGASVLAVRNDVLATLVDTDGDYAPLQVDADGALYVNASIVVPYSYIDDTAFGVATDEVAAIGCLANESSPDSVGEGEIGIPRMTLDRKQLMVIVDASNDARRWSIDASGRGLIDLSAQSLTAVKVSKDANANTETNPIFVKITDTVTSAKESLYYRTGTVAGDGTDTYGFSVAGTTFFLKSIIVASSGGAKFQLQTGPVATLVDKATIFIPKHGGVQQIIFNPAIEVPVISTGTIMVIATNRESSSQDIYWTTNGYDV